MINVSNPASDAIVGTITANGQIVGPYNAGFFQSVSVQAAGTFAATLQFEISNDGTNWVPRSLVNGATSTVVTSTTTALIASGDIGAKWFRVRASAFTSGTANIRVEFSGFSQSNTVSGGTVTLGAGTAGPQKAEDAAHASGDVGMYILGVRTPTTPAATTSAAGDYGSVAIDAEGKQIPSGQGAPETSFQSFTNLTTTTNTAVKAAAAAGVRNYLTDIVADNTGAAAARVIVQDGTTTIFSATIPAGSTVAHSFKSPIRGTAATALNAALGAAGTVSVSVSGFIGI